MNNPQLEALAKLILPALFFVIAWALNQVLSRDAAQLPGGMRPPRPPGGLPPAPMPGDRAGREVIWQEAPPPIPRREPMAGPDEIIIIGTETRPARTGPVVPVRRRRSRSNQAAARPAPVPPAPRPEASPTPAAARVPLPVRAAPVNLARLRASLASPERLREAFMLQEILGRPVALRGIERAARSGGSAAAPGPPS